MQIKDPASSKLSLRKKISLILFGLFFLFILLEIGLRLGGFVILSLQEYKNRLSLRQKGTYRIMCLGESTTQNQYPRFLEEILNQRNTGIKFSVIDKGLAGTNSAVILSQLEENLDKYKPDMVVTMMGINDAGAFASYQATFNLKRPLLFDSFRTYKLARLIWLHILAKAQEAGFYKPEDIKQPFSSSKFSLSNIRSKESFVKEKKSILREKLAEKTIKLNPKNDSEYIKLGYFYRERHNYTEAEQAVKKAIAFNPKNGSAYLELGLIYKEQGRFNDAEDAFKKAIELNPNDERAYQGLGWIYKDQRRFIEAEEFFKKNIELNPEDCKAYGGLALIYKDQSRFSDAENFLNKFIELSSEEYWAYLVLGEIYIGQNRFSEAEEVYKKAIKFFPDDGIAYGGLGTVYLKTGNKKLFEEYLEKLRWLNLKHYKVATTNNYLKLKQILDQRNVRLVCVQYPICGIEPLKREFNNHKSIVFVDNEKIFRDSVRREGYGVYFGDMFAGDFGHCTDKGNQLLAKNIADVILKEVFGK